MFREHRELISTLKQTDRHFERLFDEHNALDQRIRNAEEGQERLGRSEIEDLKKQKLQLKDRIYAILQEKTQS